MLASLTGLLLTLGGDQPAVVFDPPLDPAIFDWDGTTLTYLGQDFMKIEFEVNPPTYESNQKITFNRDVQILRIQPGINVGGGIADDYVGIRVYGGGDFGGNYFLGPSFAIAGQTFVITGITAIPGPRVIAKFLPIVNVQELQDRVESLEQFLESCQCASDLDGDGAVGFNDLVQLISDWGPCSARNLSKRFQI